VEIFIILLDEPNFTLVVTNGVELQVINLISSVVLKYFLITLAVFRDFIALSIAFFKWVDHLN
jgi:hypothetical protein